MLESLKNKVVWITGAGTGIGQAAAVALAKNGASVILSGRKIKALQETADIIAPFGATSTLEVLDVSDPASVRTTADRIVSRYGRLDILVNNAGTNITDRYWAKVTPERCLLLRCGGSSHHEKTTRRSDHQRILLGGPFLFLSDGTGLQRGQARNDSIE